MLNGGLASIIIGIVILCSIVLIAATEKHLHTLFDKEGNRKQ